MKFPRYLRSKKVLKLIKMHNKYCTITQIFRGNCPFPQNFQKGNQKKETKRRDEGKS